MEKLSDLTKIPFEEILAAQALAPSYILNTPLVKLNIDHPTKEIFLKLENFQQIGSFKVRGAFNALQNLNPNSLKDGIYTCSTGNFGKALSWAAKRSNVPCSVICPIGTSKVKVDGIKTFGGHLISVTSESWHQMCLTGEITNSDLKGTFIHPSCDLKVIAGNGVIGLELATQLPDVDTVICPWGAGGHSIGIASAIKHFNPNVKVYACEPETATPLYESFNRGFPVTKVEHFKKSFVDGMNGSFMVPCMWNLASSLITSSVPTTLREICDALTLLMNNNKIVTEGAAAAAVAAALKEDIPPGKIVCVLSGGNIDSERLATILQGNIPQV